MRLDRLTTLTLVCSLLGVGTPAAADGHAIGHLYGDEARAAYCSWAQQDVAGTELVSENVVHATIETFVESDATPYDTEEGRELPLTTHQFITTVEHPTEERPLETVLSCKLKSGEAIRYHYGEDQGELGRFCTDVHADLVERVYDTLKDKERERLVFDRDDIVLDPDELASGGGDWTSGQPQGGDYTVPQVATIGLDGRLHLRAKALVVPTAGVDVPPFVPRNKQGTHYCHLIAPDHLREIVTGDVAVR